MNLGPVAAKGLKKAETSGTQAGNAATDDAAGDAEWGSKEGRGGRDANSQHALSVGLRGPTPSWPPRGNGWISCRRELAVNQR